MKLSKRSLLLSSLVATAALAEETAPAAPEAVAAPAIPAAPEAAPEVAPEGAPAVVVSASRREKQVFETPVGVNVVGKDQLARDQPRTPGEALRNQPGVWVQQTSHIGGAPIIRGLMGNQVLLMVDGVRINTIDTPSGPNSTLQTVDVETLDRLEVVRGPGSVLYGTDALGGVVQAISAAPAPYTQEGWDVGGLAKLTFSGVDAGRRARAQAYAAGTNLRLRLGATLEEVGDLRGGGDVGLQHPSGYSALNLDARLDYKPAEGHELSASFWDVTQEDIQRYDTFLRATASESDRTRRLYRLSYEAKELLPFLSKLNATASLHDQHGESRSLTKPGNKTEDQFYTPALELQLQSHVGEWLTLTYGGHWHRDIGESDSLAEGTHTSSWPDLTWENMAAFALAEATPWERLTLSAGLRYDHFAFKTDPTEDSVPEGLSAADVDLDTTNSAINGSVGVVGRATDWLNIVAQFGTAFRAPGASDLVSSGPFTFGYSIPSPDVDPEKSMTAEGGVRIEHKYVGASLTYFYTWITDLIDREPSTLNGKDYIDLNGDGAKSDGEAVYAKTNVGEAHIQGLEGSVELRLPPHWTLALQASYITGDDDTNDEPIDRVVPFNGGAALRWQDKPRGPKQWVELNTRFAAEFGASDSPEDRLSSDPAFRNDPRDAATGLLGGDGTIPSYWLVGVSAGSPINDLIEARLTVNNLLDAEYRDKDSRIDGPGLSVVGSLLARF